MPKVSSALGATFLSPVAPILAFVVARFLQWRWLSWLLVAYSIKCLWAWWTALTIVVNGVTFKERRSKLSRRLRQEVSPRLSRARANSAAVASTASAGSPAKVDSRRVSRDSKESAKEDGADSSRSPAGMPEWAPMGPSLPFGGSFSEGVDTPYWLACKGSVFDVRNIRYNKTREKISSERAIYDCIGMDMVRDKRRIDALIDRMPGGPGNLPESPSNSPPWDQAWGVPRVLVVNCQLPLKPGSIMGGRHPQDDGGLSVLSYFVLSREACETLAQGSVSPSLRLWKQFVEEGVSTKEGNPLKVVGRIENLEAYDVPESFHRFNNKPVLLTKSAKITLSRLPEVMEIDYDVRTWVWPARERLCSCHHRAKEAEIQIGYLVEGKTDDELPEQILGCFKLVNMDIMAARWVSVM